MVWVKCAITAACFSQRNEPASQVPGAQFLAIRQSSAASLQAFVCCAIEQLAVGVSHAANFGPAFLE
ncbi:MAG: hypothetical protein ACK8QZ_12395, partial [Anaerolineales bacterium]